MSERYQSAFPESNEKRLKGFFGGVSLDKTSFARLMLKWLPFKEGYVLSLDGTNWSIGCYELTILMLAVCDKGIAFPLLGQQLDKKGKSNTREGLELIDRLLQVIPERKIDALVAASEFIGKAWFKGLKQRKLALVMRLKSHTLIGSKGKPKLACKRYSYLAKGET